MRRRRHAGWLASAAFLWLITAPAAWAGCRVVSTFTIPVTMVGLKPMTPAKINGEDAMFLVDSGAWSSMLSPAAAAQHRLKAEPLDDLRLVGFGGDMAASKTTVTTFTLGGVRFHDLDFMVAGSELGASAAGLLGAAFLHRQDVEYDLANGAVRWMKAEGCGDGDLAYWARDKPHGVLKTTPSSSFTPDTIVSVVLNGAPIRAMLDTGASSSMISVSAAARAGLAPGSPGVAPAGESRGVGPHAMQTWTATFPLLQIGDEKIVDARLRIGELGSTDFDMLLGADFFLSHRIYLSTAQRRMYFTYVGGPVFDLMATGAADTPPEAGPKDADGLSRRGAAFVARRDFSRGIADFSRAMELAPTEPAYAYQRATARMSVGQSQLAMEDLDLALRLQPGHLQARVARAQLRLRGKDIRGARDDLDAAAAAAAKPADLRLQLGALYLAAELFDPALAQFDLWIAAHAGDGRMGAAMNARCWTRALAGRELAKAASDCDGALRLGSRAALESRGLVELRRGDLDGAIADWDAALRQQPNSAWALYGRGLARVKKGRKPEGEADLAAAARRAPALPELAERLGVR